MILGRKNRIGCDRWCKLSIGDIMLIFYLLLILLSWAFFDIVQRIVLFIYHVKISTILDSIDCKEDLLFLKSKDF